MQKISMYYRFSFLLGVCLYSIQINNSYLDIIVLLSLDIIVKLYIIIKIYNIVIQYRNNNKYILILNTA